MLDVLAIGRAGIDLYSLDYGLPLVKASRFAKYVGGTAANVVVGCRRLGLSSALATRVGDDDLGRFIVDFLAEEGVRTDMIKLDGERKTGIVFAEVIPGRDSKFIFYRENAADLFVRRSDVRGSALRESKLLLVTGTGLTREPSLRTILSAAGEANRLGKTVVFNLDWRPPLWDVPKAVRVRRYGRMVELAGILVGNEAEYMAATGKGDVEEALSSIPALERKVLVVTRGEKGATVVSRGRRVSVPGFDVPLLKGLGGGDGFLSGFLFGYTKGWRLESAATFGCACGAIVVGGHSCSEAMPSVRQAAAFVKARGFLFGLGSGPSKP